MAAIAYLVLLHDGANSMNITLGIWPIIIVTQFIQDLSIVATCVPYLKPFFVSLQSGMIRNDDLRRRGQEGSYGYKGNSSQRSWKEVGKQMLGRTSKSSRDAGTQHDSSGIEVWTEFALNEEYQLDTASHSSRSKMVTQPVPLPSEG